MPTFYPWWVAVTHFLNLFFLLLLARSGLEVLSAFPKFYWYDDCPPGREWLRLSKKMYSADSRKPWSSLDEEESWSSVVALPGKRNLGLGRHWHFMSVQFWILTGVIYIVMVFATGYWQYLIPTHWSIIPDAINSIGTYLQFQIPAKIPGEPFEPAQKLAYFAVIFVLAPFQVLTGAAMSPSVLARMPWYGKIFHGKQGARSLHFLGLIAFGLFLIMHIFMVLVNNVSVEAARIVLSDENANGTTAIIIGSAVLVLIVVFHVVITWFSLRYRRRTQHILGWMVDPFERMISAVFTSRQRYRHTDISPYFRVNGYPPVGSEYDRFAATGFRDYRLQVGGLVKHSMSLSLADLRDIGEHSQITKHNCIQGWTAVAEWGGVPLDRIMELVKPTEKARYLVFYALDDKGLTEAEGRYGFFYGSIPIHIARNPQSILALDMNGAPLPVAHGAPIRVRLETQLGFKMVKWVGAIEFVESIDDIGLGQDGWREDQQFYANAAGI